VDELAAGLDTLMQDATLRRRFGVAARERTQHEFSGESYLKLFEELISASLNAFGAHARLRT